MEAKIASNNNGVVKKKVSCLNTFVFDNVCDHLYKLTWLVMLMV